MNKHKILVFIYAVVILALLTSCKKVIFDSSVAPLPTTPASKGPVVSDDKNDEPEKQPETPTKQPEAENTQDTVTNTPEPSPTPVQEPDKELNPTEAPTPTPTATAVPSPTATPTPAPLTATEARQLLLEEIGEGYDAEPDGEISLADGIYYLFSASDGVHVYYPQIAVSADSRQMFYYYSSDEMEELINFPPDNLESVGGEEVPDSGNEFTSEDAVALLSTLSATELGLPATLKEYTILVDEWNTVVFGTECFCVNAYAELENRKQLMGVYFVAVDGSAVYRSDMGDFVLIY